jgi:sugar phosphate isomerase/epimerase
VELVCPAYLPETGKLVEALPLLADQGVTAIELGLGYTDYFDHRDAVEMTALLSVLASCGLRVHSVHSPCGQYCDLSSLDDSIHERGVDALIESIEIGGVVEARKIVVHGSHRVSDSRSRRMDRARGVLREMAVVARESGITLALENLTNGCLGESAEEVLTLIGDGAVGSLGVCFDSGHANLTGSFNETARMLLPRSVTSHLNDNDGQSDQHGFPGSGTIDWRSFAGLFVSHSPKAGVVLDCLPPTGMVWSQAFQHLRGMLEQHAPR